MVKTKAHHHPEIQPKHSDPLVKADVKLPPIAAANSKTNSRRQSQQSMTSQHSNDEIREDTPPPRRETSSPRLDSRGVSRASFQAPLRRRKTQFTFDNMATFDPCEPYDFDEDDDVKPRHHHYDSHMEQSQELYRKSCKQRGLIPLTKVLHQLGRKAFSIEDLCLSCEEMKTVFVSIVNNLEITELNLSGNHIGVKEGRYLCQIMRANKHIHVLIMKHCNLHGAAIKILSEFLSTSNNIRKLDLSDNNFDDNDAPYVSRIIERNESIRDLNLSQNKLGQSGILIGHAIKDNETMMTLDLSWNHIRGYGAIGIAQGLEKNTKLTTIILAWNGFGFEGCAALSSALENNASLLSLDLANNRVHPSGLFELIKGLEKNKSLVSLRLAHNPITAPMTTILLTRILHAKESNIKELDIEGLVVDKDFLKTLEEIQKRRVFIARYDMALPLNKGKIYMSDPKNIFNIDPVRILFFMKEHLRTIDLFLRIDRDVNNSLTREEMKVAFELEGYPVSSSALDSVMYYLDTNKDGTVDLLIDRLQTGIKRMERLYPGTYREFIEGERKLKRKLIKEREVAREDAARFPKTKLTGNTKQFSQAFDKPTRSARSPFPKKAG